MSDDCLFCKILAREVPSDKVYETDTVYAFRDIKPSAPTHVLIIPRKHIASIDELTDEDHEVAGDIVLAARDIAKAEGLESGYRLVVNNGEDGGQAFFHLHFHLIGGRRMTWPPG